MTELTTSTITVIECSGCEDQVTTVPGPIVTRTITEEIEVTYTSLCPVTETVHGPTKTFVTTYTSPSTIITYIPTTIYQTVSGEDITYTQTEVEYSIITSVYPVTKVTTIKGEEQTITFTTTELIETAVPSHVYETVHQPDSTVTVTKVAQSTYTTVYPVTVITTINGEEQTVTYAKTKIVQTGVPTTIVITVSEPGETVSETEVHWVTKTTTYPVTRTTAISGSYATSTYHVTETTIEEILPIVTNYPPVSETPEAPDESPSVSPIAAAHHKRAPFIGLIVAMVGVLSLI